MMEGLKNFTDFTNRWKGRESETTDAFAGLKRRDATEIPKAIPDSAWSSVRGSGGAEKRFLPRLPTPPKSDIRQRISFLRFKEEVELIGVYYFDDADANPSEVGNRCFDDALERALGEI